MPLDLKKPKTRKKLRVKVEEDLLHKLEEEYLPYKREVEGDEDGEWVTTDMVMEELIRYFLESSAMTRDFRREMERRKQAQAKAAADNVEELETAGDVAEAEENEGADDGEDGDEEESVKASA